MHIPDGYLSPSTCVTLYTAAAPFWYVALKKVRARLHTRLVPRLALFAAFSFVLMMFNVPLPGGTSGHATGVGLATIVLGPWAGMLAISTALLIQALFFGDGGITAFGANAFNMAIVGCLVTHAVYAILRPIFNQSRWAVALVAGLAAYIAINVSALCTAFEFGTQPMLFHDSAGHPLYAPFPLSVAVPAMLLGHLTIAGLAEFLITYCVILYLARTSPELLNSSNIAPKQLRLQPAIALLAVLIALTPLGLLTVSRAWGEWSAREYTDSQTRSQIVRAVGRASVPARSPSGLARYQSIWKAPLRDYSISFISNQSAAYIVSAITGVLLMTLSLIFVGALLTGKIRQ